jgi:photosystem II Psb27 protein
MSAAFTSCKTFKLSGSQQRRAPGSAQSLPRRAVVVVRAAQAEEATATRRQVAGAAAAVVASLVASSPAHAFLGIGEGKQQEEQYAADTADILSKVNGAMTLDKDDPDRDGKIRSVRNDINQWVAKYRTNRKFAGRPSYGNTYSALNTLAGHYNSFGTQAPLPKKRLERLTKELGDAQLLLSRNR